MRTNDRLHVLDNEGVVVASHDAAEVAAASGYIPLGYRLASSPTSLAAVVQYWALDDPSADSFSEIVWVDRASGALEAHRVDVRGVGQMSFGPDDTLYLSDPQRAAGAYLMTFRPDDGLEPVGEVEFRGRIRSDGWAVVTDPGQRVDVRWWHATTGEERAISETLHDDGQLRFAGQHLLRTGRDADGLAVIHRAHPDEGVTTTSLGEEGTLHMRSVVGDRWVLYEAFVSDDARTWWRFDAQTDALERLEVSPPSPWRRFGAAADVCRRSVALGDDGTVLLSMRTDDEAIVSWRDPAGAGSQEWLGRAYTELDSLEAERRGGTTVILPGVWRTGVGTSCKRIEDWGRPDGDVYDEAVAQVLPDGAEAWALPAPTTEPSFATTYPGLLALEPQGRCLVQGGFDEGFGAGLGLNASLTGDRLADLPDGYSEWIDGLR